MTGINARGSRRADRRKRLPYMWIRRCVAGSDSRQTLSVSFRSRKVLKPKIAERHLPGSAAFQLYGQIAMIYKHRRTVVEKLRHQAAVDEIHQNVSARDDVHLIPVAGVDQFRQLHRI